MSTARSATAPASRTVQSAPLSRILLVIAVVGVLAVAPALLARSLTATEQQPAFERAPWRAWTFFGSLVTASPSARAASPGAALRLAREHWTGADGVAPRRARLAYTPTRTTLHLESVPLTLDARRDLLVEPTTSLTWIIDGAAMRADGREREGVLGAIDYRSGRVLGDVRTPSTSPDETEVR